MLIFYNFDNLRRRLKPASFLSFCFRMPTSKEIDEETDISLEQTEEDENYCKFRQSLNSMVSKRAKKYKNYSHPCLRKSPDLVGESQIDEDQIINDKDNIKSDKLSVKSSDCKLSDNLIEKMDSLGATKDTNEIRVIHRPPLPPSTSKLIYKQMNLSPSLNEFNQTMKQQQANFNDVIENILSSNANIRDYLRELRKNSELDYLLLSKILEKTLIPKSSVYVQTDEQPAKTFRSVETNTLSPSLSQKQTQTRESRILSYKLLETENLFEKLKIQQNNYQNSNYEIKRTSDLKNEEEPTDESIKQFETNKYEESKYEASKYQSSTNYGKSKYCLDCNQNHQHEQTRSKIIKIKDKFIGSQDKIHLWNNLLQIDNTSEFSEDNSATTTNCTSTKQECYNTTSENQSSTLSDEDQFSVSTRKSTKKSYSSIKSSKSIKSIKDELLSERETDLIDRYKRIKDFKIKYENEKKEFIELRKQFKNLKKKLNDSDKKVKIKNKIEFDNYHQPILKEQTKEQIKEQKKISFNDDDLKFTRFQCEEHFDLPVYETASVGESTVFDGTKEEEDEEQSYLTDSEYSVLDRTNHMMDSKNVEFIDQDDDKRNKQQQLNKQHANQAAAVKTESKILIETTNLKKKEISEISSQTELTKEGVLSRKTQVTNVKKIPVLVPINNLQQFINTKTPEPIITSPSNTTTPSATLQRKSRKKNHQRSNTVEIHSVTPSTTNCSRPTSALDLNQTESPNEQSNELSNAIRRSINGKLANQAGKGKFFTNSYSEGELNAMKKDKHCILNEQLNFGISEPNFMAYDSTAMYDEARQTKRTKHFTVVLRKGMTLLIKTKLNFIYSNRIHHQVIQR